MYKKIILFLLSFLILKCLYVWANYTVYYDWCKNTKNYIDITENMSDNDSVLINIPPWTSYNEMPDEIIFEYDLVTPYWMELRYSFQWYYLNWNKVDTPDMSNFYNVTFEWWYWNYNMSEDENKEIYRWFWQINIKPYPQNYFWGNAIPIYWKISKVRAYMMWWIWDKCGNVIIQTPSNLKQYVQSPGLEEEPINPWEKYEIIIYINKQ